MRISGQATLNVIVAAGTRYAAQEVATQDAQSGTVDLGVIVSRLHLHVRDNTAVLQFSTTTTFNDPEATFTPGVHELNIQARYFRHRSETPGEAAAVMVIGDYTP